MGRQLAGILGALVLLGFAAAPAKADLKLCNNTTSRVGVAIGYKDREGWATEGWWTFEPGKCLPLLKGDLIAKYYYVYAVDYDKGGSWGGKAMMCIRDKIFTIRASITARNASSPRWASSRLIPARKPTGRFRSPATSPPLKQDRNSRAPQSQSQNPGDAGTGLFEPGHDREVVRGRR